MALALHSPDSLHLFYSHPHIRLLMSMLILQQTVFNWIKGKEWLYTWLQYYANLSQLILWCLCMLGLQGVIVQFVFSSICIFLQILDLQDRRRVCLLHFPTLLIATPYTPRKVSFVLNGIRYPQWEWVTVYILLLLRFLCWRQVTVCLSSVRSWVVRW